MIGTRRKSLVAPVDQHDLCETLHRCSSRDERFVSQPIQPQEYRVDAYIEQAHCAEVAENLVFQKTKADLSREERKMSRLRSHCG